MILPESIREEIADRVIRTVFTVIILVGLILIVTLVILGERQYHRIIPVVIALLLISWSRFLAERGKPVAGIVALIGCFLFTVLAGMSFSGGIRAPVFAGNLVFIVIVVMFYGLRGGLVYTAIMVAIGGLFIWLDGAGLLPKVADPPPFFLLAYYGYMMALAICFVLIPVRLMLDTFNDSEKKKKELEEEVRKREGVEKELQSILDKAPDIIYRLDPEGNVTYISKAIKEYGYEPADLIGRSIIEVVHPDDRDAVQRGLMERRVAPRSTRGMEARLLRKPGLPVSEVSENDSGDWATFSVYSDGLYAGGPAASLRFMGTQGIAHDTSRLKSVEDQVAFLASVVEQAADDVIITDPQGVISFVNPQFEYNTGFSREEVIGQTPRILRSEKHDSAFYRDIWKTIVAGKIWKGRIWNRTKDGGEILQDVTITPIHDGNNKLKGYASIRRDITKQVEFDEQLRQVQKMEAIGTLAGGIAHDFNNILAGIIGYADLVRYDVRDNPAVQKKVDNILQAGHRATELVRQILSFSRSQKTNPQPIRPASIIKEVIKLLRASLPSTIEIKKELKSDSSIFADPTNIHQILMNLCTNAAHAMKESGGILSVILEEQFLDESALIPYAGIDPGVFAKISVVDTGRGVPAELQKKIFDPFFTTKAQGEGTGMGLSAVHGIVHDLGGMIRVASEPGKGATFTVFIPAIDDFVVSTLKDNDELLIGGNERILFIDDEEMQADLALKILSPFGYRVTAFASSKSALEHFQQHPHDYDLIITDMTMPGMTGDVLTNRIHLIRPEIPVILCTGFSEAIDSEKAKMMNIAELLYKPIVQRDLLRTIIKVLKQGTARSQ